MLAVKASAVSTQTSLEMLRLHLRVARLHETLEKRSRESLEADAGTLGAAGLPAGEAEGPAPEGSEMEGGLRPWPAPVPAARRGTSALAEGLTRARPVLERLSGRFDGAAGTR